MRLLRRFAKTSVLLGLLMIAMPMSMAFADTSGDGATLGFFEVTGDAAGIGSSFGNPASQPYPTAAGLIPSASSQFSAGPSGHALSSAAWPGPLAGNAGTLAGLLGIPVPADVLAKGNYPVRAEAAASGGARDEKSVGPMVALVDEKQSISNTSISDFTSPAIVSAGRVATKARSYLNGAQAGSAADSIVEDVEIGGIVHIDSIRTTATAVTDGETATLDHKVTVSGVTVAGQGATIDQDGMHFGPSDSASPSDALAEGFNQGFASAGMQAFVTKPSENQTSGGAGTVSSGAVVFIWNLGDSGQKVVLTLGGATAHVQATPGSALDLGTDSLGSFGSGDLGSSGFGSLNSPVDLNATGSFASPGRAGRVGAPVTGVPLGFENASALGGRVPMGWVLIGMLGMFLFGAGLNGVRANALAAATAGTPCPLERRGT